MTRRHQDTPLPAVTILQDQLTLEGEQAPPPPARLFDPREFNDHPLLGRPAPKGARKDRHP